jgi:ribosomal protein L11 methyltransferase
VEDLHVFEADVFKWSNTKEFKVVAANLFSTVLIEALPLIRNWIRVDGYLILSGILSEQWPEVLEVATKSGFRNELVQNKGKWVTASFSLS